MSSNFLKTMLLTLQQFESSEITLTFNNNHHNSILVVCYLNKCFQLTYSKELTIETYLDLDSTHIAINKFMYTSEQTSK